MKRSDLVLTLTQRLVLLLCVFIVCYALTLLFVYVVGRLLAGNIAATLRISAVLQDVFTFVVPAVITSLIVTRRPAELLCIRSLPNAGFLFAVFGILFVSIPFQEAVIYWNYHITLPDCFSSFLQKAREMEDANFSTMCALMQNTSVMALIVNLLIIGIAAGFSEELLFRGCFQRLLTTGGVNPHVAIWVVAAVFSALHFQFFGFVPRMLLGAYFGYLLLWSRTLWLPVLAHVMNNMMFVLTAWKQTVNGETISNEPTLWSPVSTVISVILTVALLWAIWHLGTKSKS